MGFLDHSTNNIVIDAVLTDFGRQRLAENNGQFRIAFFSLGDDEVDYGIITKFGRTVGKEKIIKNTPVFEAQTRSNVGLKHRLLSLPVATTYRFPKLELVDDGSSSTLRSFVPTAGTSYQWDPLTVRFTQKVTNGAIPDGAVDTSFSIYVNDRFIYLPNSTPSSVEPVSRTALYNINNINGGQGEELTFQLRHRPLNTNDFSTYGISNTITTPITIVGNLTGMRLDMNVSLTP